jgi:hypothetical protein
MQCRVFRFYQFSVSIPKGSVWKRLLRPLAGLLLIGPAPVMVAPASVVRAPVFPDAYAEMNWVYKQEG